MLVIGATTQPQDGASTLKSIVAEAAAHPYQAMDVAVAYATTSGARDLLAGLASSFGPRWATIEKRWIVAFDYCRSEPLALSMLRGLNNSHVRVPAASKVIEQLGMPKVPFHPKAFIFRGPGFGVSLAGSGNLSRSGLNTGHEVGLHIGVRPPADPNDPQGAVVLANLSGWFDAMWANSSPLTPALLARYTNLYESVPIQSTPAPTDDDVSDEPPGGGSMSLMQLKKLRTCSNFWIECGNVTENLGKGLPGNQLMLKRLSRVFFGVPATNVPQNSPLKTIAIRYGGNTKNDCSLTFSDNGMDKLTVPIPGHGGPPEYDQKTVLFTRKGPASFDLTVGTATQAKDWKRKSKLIDAAYTMTSGRQWGVF